MAKGIAGAWCRSTGRPGRRCANGLPIAPPHPKAPGSTSGPLWISRTGEPLSVRSISKLVSATMARAGIEESAHALRHTVATRLVRDHAHELVLVPDILGHADVKTTRRYARSDLEQRRAAMKTSLTDRLCRTPEAAHRSEPVIRLPSKDALFHGAVA